MLKHFNFQILFYMFCSLFYIGPSQMSFMFSPFPGITVMGWSLEADLVPSKDFKGRPSYFVFYQRGLPAASWTFYIDFQVRKNILMKS